MSEKRHEKTAFVFAGGGSLGAAQVGMLEALAEAGVVPSLCPQKTHPLDFGRSDELIDRGRELTREWLRAGGAEKENDYRFLVPHRH